jgi:hypothetical protein
MGSLQTYFSFYQFPTGRRLFAMRGVVERARKRQLGALENLAREAADQARHAAELESAWRRSRRTEEGRRHRANEIDVQLDRVLGGMAAHLGAAVHTFGENGTGARASALLARLFPEGAAAITRLSYENELAAAEVVLRDLKGPYADDAAAIGLAPFVERLEGLTREFRHALKQESTREIHYDTIRQAHTEGQEAMLRVVAKILGDYSGPGEEETQLRRELLGPVLSQQRRLRERYTSRRPPVDVNPETGEEITDAEEQADADPIPDPEETDPGPPRRYE